MCVCVCVCVVITCSDVVSGQKENLIEDFFGVIETLNLLQDEFLPKECVLEGVEETTTRLGGGGYGSVFLGKMRWSKVAIKRLHESLMGLDENHRPSKEFHAVQVGTSRDRSSLRDSGHSPYN